MAQPPTHRPAEPVGAFLERIWRSDIRPLLTDADEVARTRARGGARLAAAAGFTLDSILRLRGRPFTRMLTVLGGTAGALLPRNWDWGWWRQSAQPEQRQRLRSQLEHAAGAMSLDEARAILDVRASADQASIRAAWRERAARWHPDRARTALEREEHHVRFTIYQAAYQRLLSQFDQAEGDQGNI